MTEIQRLIERLEPAARRAAGHSHSPYSRFPVGAAVLDADGRVFSGCNVENASFGLTLCAERCALGAAIAAGTEPGTPRALLIYTPGDRAHSPCGACRQVMHELLAADAVVLSICDAGETVAWGPDDLLPQPFTPAALSGTAEKGR